MEGTGLVETVNPVGFAGKEFTWTDTNGDKFPQKLKEIYGIDHDRAIGGALREAGVAPDDIDMVVMTHMHFDHSGGTTRRTASGGFEPVFRRARHARWLMWLPDGLRHQTATTWRSLASYGHEPGLIVVAILQGALFLLTLAGMAYGLAREPA